MNAPRAHEVGRKRQSFNWRKPPSPLPREHIERQGLITHLAFALLGSRDAALAFLNLTHSGLGRKPLDLAGDSAAGYSSVEGELRRLASHAMGERR